MLRNMIDPEWYGVAKAVCYLLGAGCCALSCWMGYRAGLRAAQPKIAQKFFDHFRRYAAGCDRLDVMHNVAAIAKMHDMDARVEECPICGGPHVIYGDKHGTVSDKKA